MYKKKWTFKLSREIEIQDLASQWLVSDDGGIVLIGGAHIKTTGHITSQKAKKEKMRQIPNCLLWVHTARDL